MPKKKTEPEPLPTLADMRKRLGVTVAFLIAGIALVLLAALLAQRSGIGPKLELDLRGAEVMGEAQPQNGGGYRIRYVRPDGNIHARPYNGGFGWQRVYEAGGRITIVYNRADPSEFQPKSISYMPALGIGLIFVAGMWCVLRARSIALGQRRRRKV